MSKLCLTWQESPKEITPVKRKLEYGPNIRIEYLGKTRKSEALQLLTNCYYPQLLLSDESKIMEGEERPSSNQFKILLTQAMDQNMSIAAVNEDSDDKIIGVLILSVISKRDPPIKVASEALVLGKMEQIYEKIQKLCDPFKNFNCEHYIQGWVLCVDRKFSEQGVEQDLLNTLEKISELHGLEGTMMIFPGEMSQNLANECGFEECKEMEVLEYSNENDKITLKVMGKSHKNLISNEIEQ